MGSSGGGQVRKLSMVCLHNAIVTRGILVTILHCGTPEPHLSAIYIVSSVGALLIHNEERAVLVCQGIICKMVLWFVSYIASPIIVIFYDISIVIVYDVTLLLSMTYQFQSRSGKNGSMGNKTDKSSIAIQWI